MGSEQTRKSLNQLDKELVELNKKLAELTKKEADYTRRTTDVQKSITKNTSDSMLQSKTRQIQSYQNELSKIAASKADVSKKIAEKQKKRAELALKLQKEETDDQKRATKAQKQIQQNYERRIANLNSQLTHALRQPQMQQRNLYNQNSECEEYDVFVSHASEDKESFADPLCEELKKRGVNVWYDKLSISWGDSLRSKIDAGLRKSKYGIIVLSRDYIKKGWTQYELDGLFEREMVGGKIILPIWHNITKQEVLDFSPTLGGRLAMNSALQTPAEIAEELVRLLRGDSITEDSENE